MYQELHRWEDAIAVAASRVRERRGRGGISTTHIVFHLSPAEPPRPQLTEIIPLPVPPGQRPGGEGGRGEGEGGGPGCSRHILYEGRAPRKSRQAHLTTPGEPLEACLKCTVHIIARYILPIYPCIAWLGTPIYPCIAWQGAIDPLRLHCSTG